MLQPQVHPSPSVLDVPTRLWLLARARQALIAHFQGRRLPPPAPCPEGAEQARGCFVSLHTLTGELRGCLGTFEATEPLWRHVQEMVVAAATRDPRFAPVELEELEGIVLEISVLSRRCPA
ncbi:MAG TPA: AMMECR1 domain-containing protein, partial [Myxococcota bacterium]|nr:AMMECR1 domain-containing protein [Myxococcota bacterium]